MHYQGRHCHNPINTAAEMIADAQDGEKHFVLLKASRLLGGYVAGGVISYEDAKSALQIAIDNKENVESQQQAYKTIENGLKYGQLQPIYPKEDKRKFNGNQLCTRS